jgi:hypothetical protein
MNVRTDDEHELLWRLRMLLHVVGEFGQPLRGRAKRLGGMRTDGRDDVVVEIFDDLGNLFLHAFDGVVDRLADTRRRVLYLAVEVVHGTPCVRWARAYSRGVADARHNHYFVRA